MQFKYKFFDRNCLASNKKEDISRNLAVDLEKLNFKAKRILLLNQIHSNLPIVIDDEKKIYQSENSPKADAIITNLKNVAIAVITADCAPILLFDNKTNIIAAIHAGWRGARFGVIANAVNEMKKLGSNPKNIQALIGPLIHQDSYQVSTDFFNDFLIEDKNNQIFFKNDAVQGHYLFDLPAYVTKKLQETKILNIENTNINTYANIDKYASYRYSTIHKIPNDARNISLIMME